MTHLSPEFVAETTALVDAHAEGLCEADIAIIFGNATPDPVAPAAALYHRKLVPAIAVTGGVSRSHPGQIEADVHAGLLQESGVPDEAIIVERASTNTWDNVRLLRPILEAQLGPAKTAIAVVRWYHRRALILLAAHMPSIERIQVVSYEPRDPATGEVLGRMNWPSSPRTSRILKERRYLDEFDAEQRYDLLQRSAVGWVRSRGR